MPAKLVQGRQKMRRDSIFDPTIDNDQEITEAAYSQRGLIACMN